MQENNDTINQVITDKIVETLMNEFPDYRAGTHDRYIRVAQEINALSKGRPDPMFQPHPIGARYVTETDNEITRRVLSEYMKDESGYYHYSHNPSLANLLSWLDQQETQ